MAMAKTVREKSQREPSQDEKDEALRKQIEILGLSVSDVNGISTELRKLIHTAVQSKDLKIRLRVRHQLAKTLGLPFEPPATDQKIAEVSRSLSFLRMTINPRHLTAEEREKYNQAARLSKEAMKGIDPYELEETERVSAAQISFAIERVEQSKRDRTINLSVYKDNKKMPIPTTDVYKGKKPKAKPDTKHSGMDRSASQLCPHPYKKSFVTEELANAFIESQHPGDKHIRPYKCPCGALHIGHKF